MADEAFRVLVLRAVAGVRIEDQLGIREVPLQYRRVHCVDDHVVVTVDDQRRLPDRLQVLVGVRARRAPFAERLDLRRRDL